MKVVCGAMLLVVPLRFCTMRARRLRGGISPFTTAAPGSASETEQLRALNMSAFETVQAFVREASESPEQNCSDPTPVLTFNEKLEWRIQHDRRPLLPVLQDKVLVRHLAVARGVPTTPLLYHGACSSLPRVEALPSDFAAKATHLAGGNLLVVNGKVANGDLQGQPVSDDMLQRHCQHWLARRHWNKREWAYAQLAPAFVIEGLVRRSGGGDGGKGGPAMEGGGVAGEIADDLKCLTFGGRTAYVIQVSNRFAPSTANASIALGKTDTFYEVDGTMRSDLGYSRSRPLPIAMRLPSEEIRRAAGICDRLGVGLDFGRIDLLRAGDGSLFLGEVTLYPFGSFGKWKPSSLDLELSGHWCLHGDGKEHQL
jgi:hypothetical protein